MVSPPRVARRLDDRNTVGDVAHLFAYGTLLPGQTRWHFLEPFVLDHGIDDRVDGTLYDTGLGYPAARFGTGGTIIGRIFEFDPARHDEGLVVLDEVEGAVQGLYHRVEVRTANGHAAWAYSYGGGLELDVIEHGSWIRHTNP